MGYPEDAYDKGTCTLTTGSATVNFQNATLPANLRTVDVDTFGDYLLPEGYPGSLLEIKTRNSATQLTLTGNWTGSTETKIDYQIIGRSASKSVIVPNYDMIEEDFLGTVGGIGAPPTPAAHAASHQNGGADEVSVAGLSGLLADGQTPLGHNASHKHGGGDEVATAIPAANVIPKADAAGDLDAFITSATTGALGLIKLANHLGGTALLPTVIGMQETSGPTSLIIGAIADGQYTKRSGATLIGDTPGGGQPTDSPAYTTTPKPFFEDHFIYPLNKPWAGTGAGGNTNAKWQYTVTNVSFADVNVYNGEGGQVQFKASDNTHYGRLNFLGTGNPFNFFDPADTIIVIAWVKVDNQIDQGFYFGVADNTIVNYVIVNYGSNWYGDNFFGLECKKNPNSQRMATAIANDAAWHEFRLEITTATATLFIDGTQRAQQTNATYLPIALMSPFIHFQKVGGSNGVWRYCYFDYYMCREETL